VERNEHLEMQTAPEREVVGRLAEQLLLWTVPDLQRRAASLDAYERLGSALVLRRTFLEKRTVPDLARKRLDLEQPTFTYTPMSRGADRMGRWRSVLGFADGRFAEPSVTATTKQFLQATAAWFNDEPISVRQVIRVFAHVAGGAHLGTPEDDFERVTQRAMAATPVVGQLWSRSLAAIAEVTARGLQPIAASLVRSPPPPWSGLYVGDKPPWPCGC
jgi:hypothetical protein